ncbi:MAG: hypothetical protein P8L68_02705 [Paracoccaceae bacterium]|nr:hypothetical protein [Paracoccaceae bacterium]MDG2257385.1 hypothetical protein [Paracoccaceae bacterium]
MQVILHIGAHCTDDNLLIGTLRKNTEMLAERGTAVPSPSKYRKLLHEALLAMPQGSPKAGARDLFLKMVLGDQKADRLILSNENFINFPHRIFDGGSFYRLAARRLKSISDLLAGDELEIYMAIRNPATFLSAAFSKVEGRSFPDFLDGVEPMDLRWSDVIRRIREAEPDIPMTVWCNEDTPLIWTQVVRDIAALEHGSKLKGGYDLLRSIMTPEGMTRFKAYIGQNHPQNEMQLRRVIAAFLDKYAMEDAIEEELTAPGLTEQTLIAMTEAYEEDMFEIERIPGVTFLTP